MLEKWSLMVIVGKKCAGQHRLVVSDFKVFAHSQPKKRFASQTKVCKQRNLANQMKFSNVFETLIQKNKTSEETLDERWNVLKSKLIQFLQNILERNRRGGGMPMSRNLS